MKEQFEHITAYLWDYGEEQLKSLGITLLLIIPVYFLWNAIGALPSLSVLGAVGVTFLGRLIAGPPMMKVLPPMTDEQIETCQFIEKHYDDPMFQSFLQFLDDHEADDPNLEAFLEYLESPEAKRPCLRVIREQQREARQD